MAPEQLEVDYNLDEAVSAVDRLDTATVRLTANTEQYVQIVNGLNNADRELLSIHEGLKRDNDHIEMQTRRLGITRREYAAAIAEQVRMEGVAAAAALEGGAAQATFGDIMRSNHLVVGHFAAMMDRVTGVHTGFATMLRGAFNPALLAAGAAFLVVMEGVKKYKEEQREHEEVMKGYHADIIKEADLLLHLKERLVPLNDEQRKTIGLANEFRSLEWAKQYEKVSDDVETMGTRMEIANKSIFVQLFGVDSLKHPWERAIVLYQEVTGQQEKMRQAYDDATAAQQHQTSGHAAAMEREKADLAWREEAARIHLASLSKEARAEEEHENRMAQIRALAAKAKVDPSKQLAEENAAWHREEEQFAAHEDRKTGAAEAATKRAREKHDKAILEQQAWEQRQFEALQKGKERAAEEFEKQLKRDADKRDKEVAREFDRELKQYDLLLKKKQRADHDYHAAKDHMEQDSSRLAEGLLGRFGGKYAAIYRDAREVFTLFKDYEKVTNTQAAAQKAATELAAFTSAAGKQVAIAEMSTQTTALAAAGSVAAIPFVGWAMAPGVLAMWEAIGQGMTSAVAGAAAAGVAHSGKDRTETGSYDMVGGEMILDPMAGMRARQLVDMAERGLGGGGHQRGGGVTIILQTKGIVGSNQVARDVHRAVKHAQRYG